MQPTAQSIVPNWSSDPTLCLLFHFLLLLLLLLPPTVVSCIGAVVTLSPPPWLLSTSTVGLLLQRLLHNAWGRGGDTAVETILVGHLPSLATIEHASDWPSLLPLL